MWLKEIFDLIKTLFCSRSQTLEELTPENKADTLEEVNTLAESGQNPNIPENQKQAKKSLRVLNSILAGVPKATAFIGDLKKLRAAIGAFFGL